MRAEPTAAARVRRAPAPGMRRRAAVTIRPGAAVARRAVVGRRHWRQRSRSAPLHSSERDGDAKCRVDEQRARGEKTAANVVSFEAAAGTQPNRLARALAASLGCSVALASHVARAEDGGNDVCPAISVAADDVREQYDSKGRFTH